MLAIKNLKFEYPNTRHLVLDIQDFLVQKNERVFLYGPSGCGKTTLLELIAGINVASSGTVSFHDKEMDALSPSERDHLRADHMGYIFQSFNLIPYLSIEENITLPLHLSAKKRSIVSMDQQPKVARDLCEALGLDLDLSRKVTELSVGQQQRVAAARALIGQPSLILADEPTSALDYDHRQKFIELLFGLCAKNQTAILFVSHDRALEKFFDRSISLSEINKVIPTRSPNL